MHETSFKNESQIILVFCDSGLHKNLQVYFEIRKLLFSFTADTSLSHSFLRPWQFFTWVSKCLQLTFIYIYICVCVC